MHSNCDAYQTQWDEDCDDKGCCPYGKCVRFHAIGHDLQTPGYINVRENSLTCSECPHNGRTAESAKLLKL